MPNVMIPKEYAHKRSLVAIPKKDYEEFVARRRHQFNKPRRIQLHTQSEQEEIDEVLAIVKRAEQDYRAGRTRTITSADELSLL